MEYAYGSAWRRWDLHIHAPTSALNNQFKGATDDDRWNAYLEAIERLPPEVKVLGITDYWSIEGYRRLKSYKDTGRISNIDLLIPNVEMRILPVTDKEHAINLHILFDPKREVIDALESRFFGQLQFEFKGNQYSCTRSELQKLGSDFSNQSLANSVAYEKGVELFKITHIALGNLLSKNEILRANSVIGVANSNHDGNSGIQHSSLAATRQEIYRFSDFIFSGNPKDREYFIGRGSDSITTVVSRLGALKACFHGSDAHESGKLCRPDKDRFTWVKADTTFRGLRQALFEPDGRVWIGDQPAKLRLVKANSSRYIRSIAFKKSEKAKLNESWFDGQTVELNHNLVAVIGKKGSGKSALGDALALLGNSRVESDFSFLNEEKFRLPKLNKSKAFSANLIWEDEKSSEMGLAENIVVTEMERVRYIPQAFFEKVCSSLQADELFEEELQKVIFSYLPEPETLGKKSLKELIGYKSEEAQHRIALAKSRLSQINSQIADRERRLKSEFKATVEGQIKDLNTQLEALDKAKPAEPSSVPSSAVSDKQQELTAATGKLAALTEQLAGATKVQTSATSDIASLTKIHEKTVSLRRYVTNEISAIEVALSAMGINIPDLIAFQIKENQIIQLIERSKALLEETNLTLERLYKEKDALEAGLTAITNQLSEPERKRQEYLGLLSEWNEKRKILVDSRSGIAEELGALEQLPEALVELRATRNKISEEIYDELDSQVATYATYYKPIQAFTESHQPLRDQFALTFNASIHQMAFETGFSPLVNRAKAGSFHGAEAADKLVKELLGKADFKTKAGAIAFTECVVSALATTSSGEKFDVDSQLKQNVSREQLYDFLFSFDYLRPKFELTLDGRAMRQLSPGERGALLLIFYLLLDKGEVPLILDQPEENLDNETIFNLLVPCIKEAKERRQVIVATHNPNLAVVCDAEQVVCCAMDKANGFKVEYVCGAIENETTNEVILRILEGTRPAFENRSLKYLMSGKASSAAT